MVFDCPVTLECKHVAAQWLQSTDPMIQDFGARLMYILRSKEIDLSERSTNAPPRSLLPGEFQHYPWDVTPLKTTAQYKIKDLEEEVPMRHFNPFEDLETVGLRLGIFWVSPHWHYPEHSHQSLELHHRLLGKGTYLTSAGSMPLAPGESYLHLPEKTHGIDSQKEPLLTLWAERLIEPLEVPRVLSDLYALAADRVTQTLKHAAVLWLQSETEDVQRFGKKLLPFLQPRTPEMKKVGADAPPRGAGLPTEFRTCPWYPSGAYTVCMDPSLKPLKDCVMYKGTDSMFGFFYLPPGIYYPAHRHEPLEMYHVISGEARFFLADDEDSEVQTATGGPDSFWLHQPYQAHGMQTFEKAVLILWGWIGNLEDYDFHYLPSDIFRNVRRAKL